jgi:hypothetical protein
MLKLPQAFVDYINETTTMDLNQYCSKEVIAAKIAHLDGPPIVLRNYTISRAIAFRDNESMDAYMGKDWSK